jgi:serine/threonine-protein kinase
MESHLGRYEILEELGRGEMGVVYKAYDPLIDRFVAIKAIDLQKLGDEEKDEYKARFYQEAKAAGRLNHPNIITIYDLGRKGDVAYIAMELMEGTELQDIVAENQPLTIGEKLDVSFQVAEGLAYAHEHGIIHRDIKPSNIMVLRGKHVKIADFGIARMKTSLELTKTNKIIGSPLYMSPEQIQSHPVDPRSDIFSFGIVLYQMLTGKLPFNGDNVNSLMYQIVNEEPQKPSALNPEVPETLDRIVAKCLEKKTEDRYQNANELTRDLHSCRMLLSQNNINAVNPGFYFEDTVTPSSKNINTVQLIWTIVLTALLSLGVYVLIDRLFHTTYGTQ